MPNFLAYKAINRGEIKMVRLQNVLTRHRGPLYYAQFYRLLLDVCRTNSMLRSLANIEEFEKNEVGREKEDDEELSSTMLN